MPARKKALPAADDVEEQIVVNQPSSDVESDDGPPEEESNAQSKQTSRLNDERQRAEQKRKQDVRRKAAVTRETQSLASSKKKKKKKKEKEDQRVEQTASQSQQSQRLDPALFEASFAQPASSRSSVEAKTADGRKTASATSSAAKVEALRRAAEERRKAKRAGGIVRGRDGQPMRDLHDGRTIVRVLQRDEAATKADDDEGELLRRTEETLDKPTTLDATQIQPSAKASQFKRRKLGLSLDEQDELRRHPAKQQKDKRSSSKRTADDPLGLEDPAFMKGGELAHLGTSAVQTKRGKQTRSTGKQPSTLRRGDAGGRRAAVLPTARRAIPVHFARSGHS